MTEDNAPMASQAVCEKVLLHYENDLGKLPNVVGLGIVDADPSSVLDVLHIAVYVEKKVPLSTLNEAEIIPTYLTLIIDDKQYTIPVTIIAQGEFYLE